LEDEASILDGTVGDLRPDLRATAAGTAAVTWGDVSVAWPWPDAVAAQVRTSPLWAVVVASREAPKRAVYGVANVGPAARLHPSCMGGARPDRPRHGRVAECRARWTAPGGGSGGTAVARLRGALAFPEVGGRWRIRCVLHTRARAGADR